MKEREKDGEIKREIRWHRGTSSSCYSLSVTVDSKIGSFKGKYMDVLSLLGVL